MWETVLTTLILSVATAVIGVIGKVVSDWSAREKIKAGTQIKDEATWAAETAKREAIEALEAGITTVGELVVKDLKAAASDGKLSKEDIEQVQHNAVEEAIRIATNPDAIAFLTNTVFSTLSAIVTSIVQGKKSGTNSN